MNLLCWPYISPILNSIHELIYYVLFLHHEQLLNLVLYDYAMFYIYGSHFINGEGEERGEGEIMYNAIYTIVERGVASDVIEAAEKAGSKGGSVINARGAGTHETQKVFNMVIEPEKEIVLIISEADKTGAIVDAIREKVKIEEPGNGILYVTDVRETYGMLK